MRCWWTMTEQQHYSGVLTTCTSLRLPAGTSPAVAPPQPRVLQRPNDHGCEAHRSLGLCNESAPNNAQAVGASGLQRPHNHDQILEFGAPTCMRAVDLTSAPGDAQAFGSRRLQRLHRLGGLAPEHGHHPVPQRLGRRRIDHQRAPAGARLRAARAQHGSPGLLELLCFVARAPHLPLGPLHIPTPACDR